MGKSTSPRAIGQDFLCMLDTQFGSLPLVNNPLLWEAEVVLTWIVFFVEVCTLEEPAEVKCKVLNALHVTHVFSVIYLKSEDCFLNKHFQLEFHAYCMYWSEFNFFFPIGYIMYIMEGTPNTIEKKTWNFPYNLGPEWSLTCSHTYKQTIKVSIYLKIQG